ncbi:MAG: BamA/TamA family outer membrane protein [Betaproteobacteria bacterium]|nr:MAG: BamA/TamA family outer membrane protein [Betaproteobacteria bacterium]
MKRKTAGEWVVLPIPKSSPAIGTGLQVIAARFFKADEESQTSVLGAGAAYYTSDTWFVGAGGQYNFGQDRWRITGGLGYLEANYDFYGIGEDAGDRGIAFPINQTGTAAFAKVLRNVGASWYAGVGYRYMDSQVGLRVSIPGFPELEDILRQGEQVVVHGPTLSATYDTRDLNTYPRTGSYVKLEGLFASTSAFDSTEEYEKLTVEANRYWPIGDKYVLAGRVSLCGATDDAPFFDLCLYGANNDIRGYTAGRYQDFRLFAAQAEWRAQFSARWGGVVFAGLGQVAPTFGDMNSDDWLPGGGFGVRWMAAKENKVNIRADLAWGKSEDALFYLSIGEAF